MKDFSTRGQIAERYSISLRTQKDQGLFVITNLLWNGSFSKTEPEVEEFNQFEPIKIIFISALSEKITVIFDQSQYEGMNESVRSIRKEAIEKFLLDDLGITSNDTEKMDGKFGKICKNQFLQLSDFEIDKFIEGTLGVTHSLRTFGPKEVPKTRAFVTMKTVKSWNNSPFGKVESLKNKAKEN